MPLVLGTDRVQIASFRLAEVSAHQSTTWKGQWHLCRVHLPLSHLMLPNYLLIRPPFKAHIPCCGEVQGRQLGTVFPSQYELWWVASYFRFVQGLQRRDHERAAPPFPCSHSLAASNSSFLIAIKLIQIGKANRMIKAFILS